MFRFDGLAPHKLPMTTRIFRLRKAAMLGTQSFEQFLDRLGQPLVSRDLRDPSSITARLRYGEEGQQCDSGCLVFIRDIRVIPDRRQRIGFKLQSIQIIGTQVDIMKLECAFDMSSNRLYAVSVDVFLPSASTYVNMQASEVSPEIFLPFDADVLEILTSEHHDATLGYE